MGRLRSDISAVVPHVAKICITAGLAIMDVYNRSGTYFKTEKEDRSPLTEADITSHEIITGALEKLRVNGKVMPVMSEEGREIPYSERSHWTRYWLVDPLDGTKEFLNRNGEFTVNIAIIENRSPVAGFIYIPVVDELFVGIESVGSVKVRDASKNDPIAEGERLTPKLNPADVLNILASRSHYNGKTKDFIEHAESLFSEVRLANRGSSAKFCALAEGVANLYPRFAPTMEWDTAAGDAICRAVGLEVREMDTGGALIYNKKDLHNPEFIAAGSQLIGMLR